MKLFQKVRVSATGDNAELFDGSIGEVVDIKEQDDKFCYQVLVNGVKIWCAKNQFCCECSSDPRKQCFCISEVF